MAYKLIALDLDDTLLDPQKKISGADLDAIKRAERAGLHIVIASGRIYQSIEKIAGQTGLHGYTISCAGAQVVDPDGEVVFSNPVSPILAKQVVRWAATRGIYFQVFLDDGFYYVTRSHYTDYYEQMGGLQGIEDPGLLAKEPLLASKILLIDEPENLREYRKELAATFPDLQILSSHSKYLEVFSMEASKERALAFIAGKLDVEQQQIVAIGDSEVDIGMLKYAGLGIAMANSIPEVLQIADYVTASNEESGVAKALDKYVLT
ncbi:Cof-type HAD-IIB family hydrolase [Christensenellaceae bacterium OttesenSCG-928-K19]|nr:Cof-type HAD-IIB family hydrolase [Christensenellaceae bacterium OttesenSCG-928-K19]